MSSDWHLGNYPESTSAIFKTDHCYWSRDQLAAKQHILHHFTLTVSAELLGNWQNFAPHFLQWIWVGGGSSAQEEHDAAGDEDFRIGFHRRWPWCHGGLRRGDRTLAGKPGNSALVEFGKWPDVGEFSINLLVRFTQGIFGNDPHPLAKCQADHPSNP